MSSTDKTREKLMESMRMTKSEPANKVEVADTNVASKTEAAKPEVKKPATKKKETKKTAAKSKDISFPSQRIWPD